MARRRGMAAGRRGRKAARGAAWCCCCFGSGMNRGLSVRGSTRVLLALFSDIHGNRPAFAACLEAARARGAERFICLGDIVGYGADPEWSVETVMELVAQGGLAVRGNHDNAI